MADSYDDLSQRQLDRTLQTRFGLWNAIITVDGIVISAFSVLSLISENLPRLAVGLILGCCVVSLFLALLNYEWTKQVYLMLGSVTPATFHGMTEADKNTFDRRLARRNRAVRVQEPVSMLLLGAGVVGIFFLTIFSGCTPAS